MSKKITKGIILLAGLGLLLGLYFYTQLFVVLSFIILFLFDIIVFDHDFMGNFSPKFIAGMLIISIIFWENLAIQEVLAILSAIIIIILMFFLLLKK